MSKILCIRKDGTNDARYFDHIAFHYEIDEGRKKPKTIKEKRQK